MCEGGAASQNWWRRCAAHAAAHAAETALPNALPHMCRRWTHRQRQHPISRGSLRRRLRPTPPPPPAKLETEAKKLLAKQQQGGGGGSKRKASGGGKGSNGTRHPSAERQLASSWPGASWWQPLISRLAGRSCRGQYIIYSKCCCPQAALQAPSQPL